MAIGIEISGDEFDLELAVLRESVAAVDLGRQQCSSCGRTPVIGEYVFRGRDSHVDCEPCRAGRPDAPPAVIEQVRHAGGHLTVQGLGPVPAWSVAERGDLAHG
ncbi:MAG TPA: hypothetical protein PKB03_06840 [Baekduia sp.]|nr:hypothetical protein [Baekduia sp.]